MSSSAIRIRNARGELVEPARISSSDAKNRFGKFVVISVDTYQRLARADARSLNTLTEEFDALLDRMQEPGQRAAMERAFSMSPAELGRVARKHGGVATSQSVALSTATQARKVKGLASGMAVSKLVERVLTKKAREVHPLLKRSTAKKTRKRSARG